MRLPEKEFKNGYRMREQVSIEERNQKFSTEEF